MTKTQHTTKNNLFAPVYGLVGALGLFLINAATAQADITNPVIGELGNAPDDAKSGALFLRYFVSLWRVAISVGAIMVIVFFLWGAIDWIAAGGDAGKIEKARSKITQSVIGIVILVSSFTIIGFLGGLLFGEEFNLLQLTIPTALDI